MNKECYPGTGIKIASPFHIINCNCGYGAWSIGEKTTCPKCGQTVISHPANDQKK